MEDQDTPLSSEAQMTAVPTSPSPNSTSMASTKSCPIVEIKTITHIFRELLLQYLDPKSVCPLFDLGSHSSLLFDASKRSRREGVEELLQAIGQMEDERGVAKRFMDALESSGNKFLHHVIIGKEKLDDNWELKNLLLGTEVDLMKIPPLELLPHLNCFENLDKEAVRATEKSYGPQVACSELFLRLRAKHPTVIQEVINGLRAIGYHLLAQSLEDAYNDRQGGVESNGNPDGHDDDDDNGGPKEDPHDKKRRDDDDDDDSKPGPEDDKPDNGDKPNTSDATGGGEGMSGEQPGRSGGDADSDGGNIPQMLQYLKLPDTSKTTSSSISSAAETKNTATCKEASSLSTPMTIESLNLHDYQEELAEHSLAGKNSVIVAPTGSGKTRVAIAIAIKALKEQRGACKTQKKVVFVVNKVALVDQQKYAFQKYIPDVVGISGDVSSQIPLVYYLQQANVIILTAQILLNALKDDKSFSLSLLRLIILDECHNTQKENSYNAIMAYYRDEKKENQATYLPQVVGLTASLGVKKATKQTDAENHVLKLCANLDAEEISKVVEYKDSLKSMNHTPTEKTIGVKGRDDRDPFKIAVVKVMHQIEQAIFSKRDDKKILEWPREMREISSRPGTLQYEGEVTKLLEYITVKVEDDETARVLQDFANFLKMYNQSLYINRDARTVDAFNHIKSNIQELIDTGQNTQVSVAEPIKRFQEIKPQIEEICLGPSNQNPVLQRLEKILVQEYSKKPETLAILFTTTRDSTRALQAWIQETPSLEFLNPGTLTGTRGYTGMTQIKQEQLLAMFKEKKHKLVISTSVAEEGLDIQMCNLVVRYNYVSDDIGRVQARGRSRAEGGKFYLVFNSRLPKVGEKEIKNKGCEQMMEDATETVCQMIKNQRQTYLDKIAKLQREDASLRSLQRSGRLAAEKKKSRQKFHREVKLLCKHCRQFTCFTEDIRSINGKHHIVFDKGFQDRVITERLLEEDYLYSDAKASKETRCKRCKKQLGLMMVFKEHELPLLLIRYLVIELANVVKVYKKKWSDTTSIFTIKDIDLEDLAERLKIPEEDEESICGYDEKEK